jgi:hypothetical protein
VAEWIGARILILKLARCKIGSRPGASITKGKHSVGQASAFPFAFIDCDAVRKPRSEGLPRKERRTGKSACVTEKQPTL